MKQEIKFIYETQHPDGFNLSSCIPKRVEFKFDGGITLPDLLAQFELFVKALGYYPPENAHLDYVDDETGEKKEN